MMQQVTSVTIIRDVEGKAINQTLPLSAVSYALIARYCMSRRSIYAYDEAERERVFKRATELRLAHERLREADASAATGNDLNNFWVIHESVPFWLKENMSPLEKWNLERGTGFSEKYLTEPLRSFALNIRAAYEAHGIKPASLKAAIEKAAANGAEDAPAWTELKKVYLHLRSLGYADRELIQ